MLSSRLPGGSLRPLMLRWLPCATGSLQQAGLLLTTGAPERLLLAVSTIQLGSRRTLAAGAGAHKASW